MIYAAGIRLISTLLIIRNYAIKVLQPILGQILYTNAT